MCPKCEDEGTYFVVAVRKYVWCDCPAGVRELAKMDERCERQAKWVEDNLDEEGGWK